MTVQNLLKNQFTILDGGMGTMLQQKGMALGTIPETLNITKPEWIIDIHRQYIEAGSQIIYANTFGANRFKMADSGYTVSDLIPAAIKNARTAAMGTETLVALDIGPIGQLLEPTGALAFEEAYDIFQEMVVAGRDAGADLIIIETMTDLYETKAAVLAAKENSDLPVFVTMTFEENKRTFTGCSVSAMCLTMEGLGVDALGVNCSLGPRDLIPIVEEISKWTRLPIIVKPNAGLPDPVTNTYNVLPDEFAEVTKQMLPFGVRVLGGCCGTNPDYIRKLSDMLSEETSRSYTTEPSSSGENSSDTAPFDNRNPAVCTPLRTCVVSEPRIIGERINPTGKKRFKQALAEHQEVRFFAGFYRPDTVIYSKLFRAVNSVPFDELLQSHLLIFRRIYRSCAAVFSLGHCPIGLLVIYHAAEIRILSGHSDFHSPERTPAVQVMQLNLVGTE